MNNKVNYTLIGFLVLAGVFVMLAFTYWMLKPTSDSQTQKYAIYFNESVSGLNLNSPVKYRGINVGKVVKLQINPKNSEQVLALVEILKSTPIKENTVAKLTAQGITGLSYINLTQGKNDAPQLKVKEGESYPVIKSVPSLFEHFENSLGDVTVRLSAVLDKTQQLLDNENQKQIALLLNKTAGVMNKVDKLLDEKTITHFQNSISNLEGATYKIDAMVPNIDHLVSKSILWQDNINSSFASIKQTYLNMNKTMENMALSFKKSQQSFDTMSLHINNTMIESHNVMIELENTLEDFNHNPSAVLYEKRALKTAPGER